MKTQLRRQSGARLEAAVRLPNANDIFFADFPHEVAGGSVISKYTLRTWLIGHAVMRGWNWMQSEGSLAGYLTAGQITVRVEVISGGLRLTEGDREEVVETQF